MENDYTLNPSFKFCLDAIEPRSLEKEVHNLWIQMIWTVFPASDNWYNQTKQGVTEPNSKVMKVIRFTHGLAPIDVLMVELRRPKEDVSAKAFFDMALDLLDDHISQSDNPEDSILFGAVGIGQYVHFYQRKVGPGGVLQSMHANPFHLERDAVSIQGFFDYFKQHVPGSLFDPATVGGAA